MLVEYSRMFDPGSDYAPDLEWMLQSGQVPPDLLLEALIGEYYISIYRFALCVLDDRNSARKAARDVFSRSVVEIHKYRPQDGVELWLFRIALEVFSRSNTSLQIRRTIQAYLPSLAKSANFGDSLPEDSREAEYWLNFDAAPVSTRVASILHFVLEWPLEKIGKLTGRTIEEISADLQVAIQSLRSGSDFEPGDSNSAPFGGAQPSWNGTQATELKRSLQKRWPPVETSQEDLERLTGSAKLRARFIGTRQKSLVSIFEILVIGFIILVGVGLAWGMDRFGENDPLTPTPTQAVHTVLVTEVALHYVTATPEPPLVFVNATPTPTQFPQKHVVTVGPYELLESIAERIGTTAEILQAFNRLPPGTRLRAGQRLLVPGEFKGVRLPLLTPVPTQIPAAALEEPYFSESVLQRIAIEGPIYSTLWFDAIITDFGPHSYSGPARAYRWQSWQAKDQSLSLIGPPGDFPHEVLLRNQNGLFFARPSKDMPWFSEWRSFSGYQSNLVELISRASNSIFDTRDLERGVTFDVTGRAADTSPQALVVDLYNQEKQLSGNIWYDDQRGLILRRTSYSPVGTDSPAFEVKMTGVEYDVNFPAQLFSERIPWRGGYAANSSGLVDGSGDTGGAVSVVRSPQQPAKPQEGFDPAASTLSFHYPADFDVFEPVAPVEIFADGTPLGETELGNPWEMICDRSPDGSWIAFVSQPARQAGADSRLRWFGLPLSGESVGELTGRKGVTEIAISPNSRKIAYFANSEEDETSVLGVVNILSGGDRLLLKLSDVNSLVWSPDGNSLAMIARENPGSYLEHILVYDISRNEITYNAPIDVMTNAYQDWPMLEWGVDFPVEKGRLDDCARAPHPDD